MGASSGSSTTSSTQPYIMSGPTVAAANAAAGAQIQGAQQAEQAITQNTTSAIQSLMGQYSTAMQIENPSIAMGNQAAAQINYLLGLPAVNPGPAPVAPVAPTAPTIADPTQLEQLLNSYNYTTNQGQTVSGLQNALNQPGAGGGINQALTSSGLLPLINGSTGIQPNTGPAGGVINPNDLVGASSSNLANPTVQELTNLQQTNPNAYNALYNSLPTGNQTAYNTALQNYDTQNAAYQQQDNLYNQQENLYNTYQGMGQATPSTISNIVSNLPGFQFAQQQGLSQIQNAASASGQLNSGNLLESINHFGQGLSQQYYQNYLGNLATQAGLGQQAATTSVNSTNNLGSNLASAYTNQGAGQANASLAQGNALAQSYLLPVANQQVVMTPYTTSSSTDTSGSSFSGAGVLGAIGSSANPATGAAGSGILGLL